MTEVVAAVRSRACGLCGEPPATSWASWCRRCGRPLAVVEPPVGPLRAEPDPDWLAALSAHPPAWGMGDAWLGILAGLGLVLALALLLLPLDDLSSGEEAAVSVLASACLWLGTAGVALRAVRRKGSGSAAIDFGLEIRLRHDLGWGLLGGLVLRFAILPVVLMFRAFEDEGPQTLEGVETAPTFTFIALALVIVVGAPFFEELFFRGLVLRALARRFSFWPAAVLSSLLFGLGHVHPGLLTSLELVASTAVVGLGLAWMARRYGRLGPSIFAHATFNAVVVAYLASLR